MNTSEDPDIFVHPCVNGNSSTGEYFNYTQCHFTGTNCTPLTTQPGATIVSPIILALTGITGQICALVYLHRGTRPSNHRTTFYVMLATLIWTDLIGKIITTPLPVLSYVKGHWVGGSDTCNIHGYAMSLIGILTHLLVAAMALERYLGIRCGYFYNRNVTTSRARIMLIGIWCFSLIFVSFPLFGIGKFKLHYPGSWCHINKHVCSDHPLPDIIFSYLYDSINLCCFCLIVICNLVVVGSLLKMRVTKYKPSTSGQHVPTTKKSHEREIQMVILLVIITVTFSCSWLAHDLLMIKNQLWPPPPNRNPSMDIKAIRLVSINQIVDPWSYIICRMIFRSKLWKFCNRAMIGKMSLRRFSSRMDGDSALQSMAAKARSPVSTYDDHKRASLPYCNGRKMSHQDGLSQDKFVKDKSSCEHSLASVSDHGCFSSRQKKKGKICGTFAKLFKSRSKEDFYTQMERRNPNPKTTKDSPLLAPFSIPLDYPATNAPLCLTKSLNVTSFVGRPSHRCISSSSDFDENEYSQLHVKETPSYYIRSHVKVCHASFGLGSSTSTTSLLVRSNSWCCPNEYTLRFNKAKKA